MPIPPREIGYFDKVNYVVDAWANPCQAPWYIYVSTLKPALLAAFITLATFGWDDVARGYFRPRGLNLRRTGKRKGKWARRVPRFPEFGEEIGKRLPGAEEVKGKKWGALGNSLWRIDTVIQQALFWWLVADVTIDLAYNFTSVLYETRWCETADRGGFSYQMPQFRGTPPGGWWNGQFGVQDYEEAPPTWRFISGTTGPNGAQITCAFRFETRPGFAPPLQTAARIIHDTTGEVYGQTGPAFTNPDGSLEMTVSGAVPPNTVFRAQGWHDTDWANMGDGVVVGKDNGSL